MSSFPILDLVIGLVFIFFLLSIICSSAVELCLSVRATRPKMLAKWLKTIFNSAALDSKGIPMLDKNSKPLSLGQAIMDHCMVTGISKPGTSTSYINAENFVSALLDKITISRINTIANDTSFQSPPDTLEKYIEAIKKTDVISDEIKRVILMMAYEVMESISLNDKSDVTNKNGVDQFREKIEAWYNTNGDRLTDNLKGKKVLPLTIVAAIVITVSLNADIILISKYLYENKAEAAAFADKAMTSYQRYSEGINRSDTTKVSTDNSLRQMKQDIDSLKSTIPKGLPLGWTVKNDNWSNHIVGWLMSVFAIMLGAPFWFDLLNKIANLRNTGPRPITAETKKDKKE